MFSMLVEHKLSIEFHPFGVNVYEYTEEYGNFLVDEFNEDFKDHETPEAAARYAIAMALVKLAESE